ncbi:MAG TPA: DNA alkylation repair protein [bacterium]|nr:DNA alkylation repair protein [bacterium]
MHNVSKLVHALTSLSTPDNRMRTERYYKTDPGEYASHDIFLGVPNVKVREISQAYSDLKFEPLSQLFESKYHEVRLATIFILVNQYQRTKDNQTRETLYQFYLQHLDCVNNWDLVDLSADKIIGSYLLDKPNKRKILYRLAKSKNLWHRRVSIIATWAFIRKQHFSDTLLLCELLLADQEDLIHKACGWMLREVGKRDQALLEAFLKQHIRKIPRTTLRYAIEKFNESKRHFFLSL